ncbi:cell division protein ZapA [Bartonella sp. DGB1]|uniref:cell division protein ZapA n=1 Tax=Bartonella sp. DGB1 TaxID=3239807 RepID=UPI003525D75A
MATVTVTIDGKIYRMACGEGQEKYLCILAEEFDKKIAQLRSDMGEIGDLRLTIIAGITFIDELSETKKQLQEITEAFENLKNKKYDLIQIKLQEMTERIRSLSEKLNLK